MTATDTRIYHADEQQCIAYLTEHYGTSRAVNTLAGQSHIFGCMVHALGVIIRRDILRGLSLADRVLGRLLPRNRRSL